MKSQIANYSKVSNESLNYQEYASADLPNREALILKYAPLIKFIAYRLAMRLPPHIAVDDLMSAGAIGLMDALNKFNPDKNVQFATYAEYRIKGAMLDELRALDWVPRSVRQKMSQLEKVYLNIEREKGRPAEDEEVAETLGLSLDDFFSLLNDTNGIPVLDIENIRLKIPVMNDEEFLKLLVDEESGDPSFHLSIKELKQILVQSIDKLSQKEKTIISLYYYDELTLKEIGEVMGFTESRICQIHAKAILKLRAQLKKYFDNGH